MTEVSERYDIGLTTMMFFFCLVHHYINKDIKLLWDKTILGPLEKSIIILTKKQTYFFFIFYDNFLSNSNQNIERVVEHWENDNWSVSRTFFSL